jgi:glycosyltransferase involved in cell wall biosynthesis
LSELFYPHGGGAELSTYLYADLLSRADFNVIVLTNRFPREPEVSKNGNLTIYRLPLFKENESAKYSTLKRFDVLFSSLVRKIMKWADCIYVPRFWYSAIPLAKAYGKPVITHLHDYIPICPLSNIYDVSKDAVCNKNSLLCPPKCIYTYGKKHGAGLTETLSSIALNSTVGRCFGKLVEFSDVVICVSKVHKDIITKNDPSLSNKTCVIYNPLPELSCMEIEGDDFGYFGGPNCLKGFSALYHAMVKIKDSNLKLKIQATRFLDRKEKLAKLLKGLGFVLHGKLDKDEYEKLYRKIRSVIVPSLWHEPWPYVVVEAIIRGRFVIASRIGGIPEQVDGIESAMLCEPNNPQQLTEAIEFIRSLNRENITELGLKSREVFLKRFSNETTIRRFISICEHLT